MKEALNIINKYLFFSKEFQHNSEDKVYCKNDALMNDNCKFCLKTFQSLLIFYMMCLAD